MFTGDRATAPATRPHTCRSPPGREHASSKEADRLFVFGDQAASSLRVRINSLGTDERILECGVEADGDRHMYIAREGGHGRSHAAHGGASGSLS
jgi:hypothetical protein